jgi:hypothetical protein
MIFVVGPGTGGDPNFVAIDPALKRPHMARSPLVSSRVRARTR